MNRPEEISTILESRQSSFEENNIQLTIPKEKQRYKLVPQLVATVIVSWLSMIDGYASAYFSPADSTMSQELNLTKTESSWICSLLPFGAIIGSVSGGTFVECLGRKKTLIITDTIFFIAWLLNYFSWNSWTMYVSRVLSGYSVGIASFAVPVYLAESLQPSVRGRFGLFPTAFGNFGILISFSAGNVFEWRDLAALGLLLTVPFLVVIWLLPESPRWYLTKQKYDQAESALQWLRGKKCNVEKELEELNQRKVAKIHYSMWHLKVFLIVLGLMFFQQFSGINAVIFYTTQIFEDSGSSLNASICTAIIGIVNFISTFLAAFVVDRLGRKVLMYTSSLIMASMLGVLGLYFYLLRENYDLTSVEFIPLCCFILYVLGFSFGLGPIPWLMMGEILPAAFRGSAASLCAAFNWSCTFVITKTFPLLVDSVGAHYVFWFFCFVMICSLLFLKLVVPETKKRTLEDIETKMSVKRVK